MTTVKEYYEHLFGRKLDDDFSPRELMQQELDKCLVDAGLEEDDGLEVPSEAQMDQDREIAKALERSERAKERRSWPS